MKLKFILSRICHAISNKIDVETIMESNASLIRDSAKNPKNSSTDISNCYIN